MDFTGHLLIWNTGDAAIAALKAGRSAVIITEEEQVARRKVAEYQGSKDHQPELQP